MGNVGDHWKGERGWRGWRGFRARHVDDGDPHVYIKTTKGTLLFTAAALVGFGYWLGG